MAELENKLLLLGGNGMLARKILSRAPSKYKITSVDLPDFDITNSKLVHRYLDELKPDVIVNCAAYTDVDGCETNIELANQVNGQAVQYLADAAIKIGAVLVHVSTDYVFDGQSKVPYVETDNPNPQSAYGRSKLLGEQAILKSGLKKFFIVRTSWLYGPGGKNFVETIIRLASQREELGIVSDQVGCPTYTEDLADAVFSLLEKGRSSQMNESFYGIYHFSNSGQCSWYDFAREVVSQASLNGEKLVVKTMKQILTKDYPLPATRPAYSVMSKQKYLEMTGCSVPCWQESLVRYMKERHAMNLSEQYREKI